MKKISIVGTAGIPASYGGFETLAENLCLYHHKFHSNEVKLFIYCDKNIKKIENKKINSTNLIYSSLSANGFSSIFYDVITIIHSCIKRDDVILILGISGSIILPIVKKLSGARIVTNIDGLEWKREKWGYFARKFLKKSEEIAIIYSDDIISDNRGIYEYVKKNYGKESHIIEYGGDNERTLESDTTYEIPSKKYALALCRIEPENNVHIILDAFSKQDQIDLIFIGNWNNSNYGKILKKRFSSFNRIKILDPIYNPSILNKIRSNCEFYVHGHSAGGTNPSLVEMMHYQAPIISFDCIYNRYTLEDNAIFFKDSLDLEKIIKRYKSEDFYFSERMNKIAKEKYTWDIIGKKYFKLLLGR